MNGFRVSLIGLIGLVALATGLTLVSLRSNSPWSLTIASAASAGLILSGSLGVFFLRDDARAFSAGFTLLAGVMLVLVNWDSVGHGMTRGLSDLLEVHQIPDPRQVDDFDVEIRQRRQVIIGNLVQTTRLTASIAFGLIGGLIASTMASRARRERETPRAVPSHE